MLTLINCPAEPRLAEYNPLSHSLVQGSDEDGDSAGGAAGPPATGSTAAKGVHALC